MIVPSNSQREFLEEASRKYALATKSNPDAVGFLESRGLTPEIVSRYQIGVVDDPLPGHELYRGMISIPYLTPSGSVTTIRWRNLTKMGPKYLSSPGDIPRIYNTDALERASRAICITEGEIDALTAEMVGLPAVGLPGAQSWRPAWKRLFVQYDIVMILQDDDDAGKEFSYKLQSEMENARTIVMTHGDVNSFFLKHGAAKLRKLITGKGD